MPTTISPNYITPNIYADHSDAEKDTPPVAPASPHPDSALVSGRRSTGGAPAGRVPLGRIPFTALQLVGRHLPPAAAAQYSLMSKPLHDAWYPEAKEAVKKMLKAELKHLCTLALHDDEQLNALAAEALLKAVAKLPAADQVEVLAHTLETIRYRDKNNRHIDNTISALKKVHCMKLLAQAAMKLEHDDALQMVALKFLTTPIYLHNDLEDRSWGWGANMKSPWGSIDLVARLDFAQRAVVAGEPSLVEALSCLSILIVGMSDEFWVGSASGDEVSETEDASQDTDLEIIDQKANSLLNLIIQQIVAKPAATLAYEFGDENEDEDARIKDLFLPTAIKIIASLQENKSEDILKFQTKLMQAYAKVIDKDEDEDEDKDSSSSKMATLGGREMPIDKALAQLFFGVKIQASDPGLSQSEATSKTNEALDYAAAMDIGWFPREERKQRLKEIFEFIRDISESKRLRISDCLKIMPYEGELFDKFANTLEYNHVEWQNPGEAAEVTQARKLLDEVTDNLKQRITSRLEEFGQKPYLEGEEVDNLVALFKMSPDALGDATMKTLREQLAGLLFKVEERDYSKLAPLMRAVVIAGASGTERQYQLDQLTQLVEKAIHSNTMGFHEGAQLLVNLDAKTKEYSGAYTENRPVEKVNALMTEHLKRRDFGTVSVDHSFEENIDYGCYAGKIDFEARSNNDFVEAQTNAVTKEKTDSILKKYIPETDPEGKPHPPNRQVARAMTEDEALILKKAGLLSVIGLMWTEEKNQPFRLFTEGALPPEQFMERMYIWNGEFKKLEDLPRLNALVNAADNLEQKHAADIEGGKISPALVFQMTQNLLSIAKQQPDDVPGRDSKAKVIAQIHAIEDRHIARLGGEKRDRVAEAVAEAQEQAEQTAMRGQVRELLEARRAERQHQQSARLAFFQDLQVDEDDDSDEDMPPV
jgi:hypothetical protein